MKIHLLPILTVVVACLVAALSTGSTIFLLIALLLLLLTITSFVSVWQAGRTVQVTHDVSQKAVQRGDHVIITISISHKGIIPIAPITLFLSSTPDMPPTKVRLREGKGRTQRLSFPFDAIHVGVCNPGVQSFIVEDMFGLFSWTRTPKIAPAELLVLPLNFPVEDVKFAPGDAGWEAMARATEDITNPADVRTYQPGDALKKIHWKLSARKGELLVRRFEEPALPDALVLLDCAQPPFAKEPEKQSYLKDTLLETAASVVQHQMTHDNPVRLPLQGNHPTEFEKSMGLPVLLEELARLDFSQTDRFERVLLLETRRMRRTGATVIITARLNSLVVDMLVRIRRMGPFVRLYLVTFSPDDPQMLPMISKLQQNTIEVCYVTPCA